MLWTVLNRCASIAHELCWTSDCREAPRHVRPTLGTCVPSLEPVPKPSACMLLPVSSGSRVCKDVAFVVCTLRVFHGGLVEHAALPRGVGHNSLHHQGHLACALGLG